jgi:hypothetical protein
MHSWMAFGPLHSACSSLYTMSETCKSHRNRIATKKARGPTVTHDTPTENPHPRPPKSKPQSKAHHKGKQKAQPLDETTDSEVEHTRDERTASKHSHKRKRPRRHSTTSIEEVELPQHAETEVEEVEAEEQDDGDAEPVAGDERERGGTPRSSQPRTMASVC